MSDEPDSIVLRYLRKLDEKIDRIGSHQQEASAELRAIKGHLSAFMQGELAQDSSIASILTRLEKLERRLDLTS
ncbi:MAG: hypothetical protein QNI87_08415 [Erythrobacter sp.]|uniref:hypothetical protein n=1 Tax=Erythrobacter sp. TaxID=1042 RepID=UPI0026348116|nr:hypothetical protein [Erythrobacter sp.]MDJ0978547.1 hypothetical protein [Erythrobacter sp.]